MPVVFQSVILSGYKINLDIIGVWSKCSSDYRKQWLKSFQMFISLWKATKLICDTAAYIHALNRHAEAVLAQGTQSYFHGMR